MVVAAYELGRLLPPWDSATEELPFRQAIRRMILSCHQGDVIALPDTGYAEKFRPSFILLSLKWIWVCVSLQPKPEPIDISALRLKTFQRDFDGYVVP